MSGKVGTDRSTTADSVLRTAIPLSPETVSLNTEIAIERLHRES